MDALALLFFILVSLAAGIAGSLFKDSASSRRHSPVPSFYSNYSKEILESAKTNRYYVPPQAQPAYLPPDYESMSVWRYTPFWYKGMTVFVFFLFYWVHPYLSEYVPGELIPYALEQGLNTAFTSEIYLMILFDLTIFLSFPLGILFPRPSLMLNLLLIAVLCFIACNILSLASEVSLSAVIAIAVRVSIYISCGRIWRRVGYMAALP